MRMEVARGLALSLLLSASAEATETWIVDDDGGAGIDFADLPTAVDSPLVADGDILLVQPGTYDTLVVTRPLTILGQGDSPSDVYITTFDGIGSDTITDVVGAVTVANVEIQGHFYVRDCSGPVTLAHVIAGPTELSWTEQVRVEDMDVNGGTSGLYIRDAAVEVNACDVTNSVIVSADAYLRMASTPVLGSDGSDATAWFPHAGDGGGAIRIYDAEVQLVGRGELVQGGDGGWGNICSEDGQGGPALHLDDDHVGPPGFARHSGVRLQGGYIPDLSCSENPQADPILIEIGSVVEPESPDPLLRRVGVPRPGATIELSVAASESTAIALFAGFTPLNLEIPGTVGRLAVTPDLILATGVGVSPLEVTFTLGTDVPLGLVAHAQAVSLYPSGEAQRFSNPVALVIH